MCLCRPKEVRRLSVARCEEMNHCIYCIRLKELEAIKKELEKQGGALDAETLSEYRELLKHKEHYFRQRAYFKTLNDQLKAHEVGECVY